jgi:predicted N-acyltransferase
MGALTVRICAKLSDLDPVLWDGLVGDESPFLEWGWLASLEDAGCVARQTGWLPQHITLWDQERLVGACPLYVKGHSQGEFVFDHGWADAVERAGLRYYPKLLVAALTPATGARLTATGSDREEVIRVFERCCRISAQSNLLGTSTSSAARTETPAQIGFARRTAINFTTNSGWFLR